MFEMVKAIHEALHIESTWAFVLVIALVFGVMSGSVAWVVDKGYKNALRERAETAGKVAAESATERAGKGRPASLKELFESDWPNLPGYYNESTIDSQSFGSGSVKIGWRVNGDFIGRGKFLAFIIDSRTAATDATRACEAIADRCAHFLDAASAEIDMSGQGPDDTAPTHLKDMVFSRRVFIYYEDFSLAQKGMLETIYQNKGLSVQFRDAAYAWAHRDQKPREKPLTPNTTLLPDAKFTPGLRITIAKIG